MSFFELIGAIALFCVVAYISVNVVYLFTFTGSPRAAVFSRLISIAVVIVEALLFLIWLWGQFT